MSPIAGVAAGLRSFARSSTEKSAWPERPLTARSWPSVVVEAVRRLTNTTSAIPSALRSPTTGVESTAAVVHAHSSRSVKGGPAGRTWHASPARPTLFVSSDSATAEAASTKARTGLPRNDSDPDTGASTASVSSGPSPLTVT